MSAAVTESQVVELAEILYPGLLPQDCLFAMLAAYCDESGIHDDSEVFVVAGYVGAANEFTELANRWNAKLKTVGLTRFHATECEGGQREFKSLSRQQRENLQRELIRVINARAIYGAAFGIVMKDYHALLRRLKHLRVTEKYKEPAYFLAFEGLICEICHAAEHFREDRKISFVFDQQKQYQGRAKELYDGALQNLKGKITYYNRLGPLIFGSSIEYPQLQAADMLAYETYRYAVDCRFGGKPKRWQLEMLQERSLGGKLYNHQALEDLLAEAGL